MRFASIASEITVVKTFVGIGRFISSAKEYHYRKMLLAFLEGLRRGENTIDEFNSRSEKEKADIRALVISQLETLADVRQAEAIGLAVDAYLFERIDQVTLMGIISEIKLLSPIVFYNRAIDIALPDGLEHDPYINARRQAVSAFTLEAYRPMCNKYGLEVPPEPSWTTSS